MDERKVHDKIIALTKEISFKPPLFEDGFVRKFIYQASKSLPLSGSICLEWWLTEKGMNILDDISRMSSLLEPLFGTLDNETFGNMIENVLQDNALNEEVFHKDTVFFRKARNLFEARSIRDPQRFASLIWERTKSSMLNSMVSWLVIYPLHRIISKSFDLDSLGVTVLESNDINKWRTFIEKYPDASCWNITFAKRIDRLNEPCCYGQPPSTWLTCEVFGKDDDARASAGRQMMIFLSVLFAYMHSTSKNLLQKSMAKQVDYSMQFPNDGQKAGYGQKFAFIGNLLPPLLNDFEISEKTISDVKTWYTKYSLATEEKIKRMSAAAIFMNYGMVSDEVEKFIHFFICLDALFGSRNAVEKGILHGIQQIFPKDKKWIERSHRLYDLRCALIHGQTHSIKNWQGFSDYVRIFRSEPAEDITNIAMTALRLYFELN